MTNEQQLKVALENQKRLEKRVAQLEEEMLTCLAFMRKHAQRMAGIKGENHEA
jgi:type II secretory pathway component PulJ